MTDTYPVHEIQEDEPGWDCHTMGNRICGPEQAPTGGQGVAVPVATYQGDTLPVTGGDLTGLALIGAVAFALGAQLRPPHREDAVNLYLLQRVRTGRPSYDDYLGAVVLATSAKEAREIAAASDTTQGFVFRDPGVMSIRRIDPNNPIRPRVVLTSYLHG